MMRSLGIAVLGVSFLVGKVIIPMTSKLSQKSFHPLFQKQPLLSSWGCLKSQFSSFTRNNPSSLTLLPTWGGENQIGSFPLHVEGEVRRGWSFQEKKVNNWFGTAPELQHKTRQFEEEPKVRASPSLPTPSSRTLQVLFYNVENLFHPSDDSTRSSDDPYTAEGEHEWHRYRYKEKLSGIFKVIAAVGKGSTPAIMGFAELEERRVLEDLLRMTPLDRNELCILQYQSPDHRGMDVGMIYRKDRFQPSYVECLEVELEAKGGSPTREMLYVKGEAGKDTLHLFVAHWPSRWGGRAKTDWKRMTAARRLKKELDSIEAENPDAAILIMGDLNDTPINRSVQNVLEAGRLWGKREKTPWYDLMAGLPKGTYFHEGHWSYLDHFIVPRRMTRADEGSSYEATRPKVHELSWLLKERRGEGHEEMVPHRCFSGPAYIGGISDHLPISVVLRKQMGKGE